MSFSKKLIIVGLVWCVFGLVAVSIAYQAFKQAAVKNQIILKSQEISSKFEQVLTNMIDLETGVRGYILTEDEDYLTPFNQAETLFDKRAKELLDLVTADGDQKLVEKAQEIQKQKNTWMEQTAVQVMLAKKKLSRGMISAADFVTAFKATKGKEQTDFLRKIVDEVRNYEAAKISNLMAEQEATESRAILVMGLGLPIISIVGLIFLVTIVKSVEKRIRHLISSVEIVSSRISENSKKLNESSGIINEASAKVAASLQETAAATGQLSAMTEKNHQTSGDAAKGGKEAQDVAESGKKEILSLIESMHRLHSSSSGMTEIVAVIDDIAFQTNLLALNASVEAARAGEHGRGFSVVAEAVRSLAQKAASSAKDIGVMILQNTETAQTGMATADRSNKILERMLASVSELNQKVSEVATASEEQTLGLKQISTAITEIDQAAQQNAAISGELSDLSNTLDQGANLLKNSIKDLSSLLGSRQKEDQLT